MVKHEIIGLWWWGKDCSLWGGVMVIACQIYDRVYLSHMSLFRDNHGIIGIVNETDMVPHSGNLLCLWPTSRGPRIFESKRGSSAKVASGGMLTRMQSSRYSPGRMTAGLFGLWIRKDWALRMLGWVMEMSSPYVTISDPFMTICFLVGLMAISLMDKKGIQLEGPFAKTDENVALTKHGHGCSTVSLVSTLAGGLEGETLPMSSCDINGIGGCATVHGEFDGIVVIMSSNVGWLVNIYTTCGIWGINQGVTFITMLRDIILMCLTIIIILIVGDTACSGDRLTISFWEIHTFA